MNTHSHCRSKVSEWSGNACAGGVLAASREQLVVRDKYFVQGTISLQEQAKGQHTSMAVMLSTIYIGLPEGAHGRISAPPHPGNLKRHWQPGESNIQPQHLRRRTLVFAYSTMLLSNSPCKVKHINLSLRGWLLHLMWVSCDCVHWCEYEPLNEVCDSKREYTQGHFNIFSASFIFRFFSFP